MSLQVLYDSDFMCVSVGEANIIVRIGVVDSKVVCSLTESSITSVFRATNIEDALLQMPNYFKPLLPDTMMFYVEWMVRGYAGTGYSHPLLMREEF